MSHSNSFVAKLIWEDTQSAAFLTCLSISKSLVLILPNNQCHNTKLPLVKSPKIDFFFLLLLLLTKVHDQISRFWILLPRMF